MRIISPAIKHLTSQLLTGESVRLDSANDEIDRAVRACEKLRVPLTKLGGSAGFSMLLSRAVALASQQDSSLASLRVETDGSLSGVDAVRRASNGTHPDHPAHHGGEIVLAELLGLLVSFLGESLTLTLIRGAWPDARLEPNVTDSIEEKP